MSSVTRSPSPINYGSSDKENSPIPILPRHAPILPLTDLQIQVEATTTSSISPGPRITIDRMLPHTTVATLDAFGDNVSNDQLMAMVRALANTTSERGLHIIRLLEEADEANNEDPIKYSCPNGFMANENQAGPIAVPDYKGGNVRARWIRMAPNYQVEATQGAGFPTYYVNIYAIPADLEEGEVLPTLPH